MKRLVVVPDGMPMSLEDLPPGLFMCINGEIGIKDEYDGHGYCTSGEYWCSKTAVMPAHTEVFDDEE